MWPFSGCSEVDSCVATNPNAITAYTVISLAPFVATFTTVSLLVVRHVFPRLSRAHEARDGEEHFLPAHAPAALRQVHAEHGSKSWQRRGAAWTFGATIGLAATLGALILAEILEFADPKARSLAHSAVMPTLLFMLVVWVPWLECRSLVSAAGWSFQRSARGKLPHVAVALQLGLFGSWLFLFWLVGRAIPATTSRTGSRSDKSEEDDRDSVHEALVRACLERVAVVGISLMALLAGFASVSAPWHTFSEVSTRRKRPITDADVTRKRAGLEATNEMLLTKRHRLRALERKSSEAPQGASNKSGLMGRMMGSIRGASGDEYEMQSLRVEIAGLETMETQLASNLSMMEGQRHAAARASTTMGRIFLVPSYVFSCYCVYRILATALTTLRRASSPSSTSFSSSDPINRFLGLLARHWDPTLDQMAWARIISFVLSGVMLLLSANSVVQTLHLFSRWTPPILHRHAQSSLALAAGQVAATYVIASALLLRGHLPAGASSAVGGALARGAPLMSPRFADGWFEGWFLVGSVVTGAGIWIGRTVGSGLDGDWIGDDYEMEEMGAKRS